MKKTRQISFRRTGFAALAASAAVALSLAGCSTVDTSDTSNGDSDSAAVTEPIEGRPVPVGEADEEVKISIIAFANNPYWVAVEDGAKAANSVLAAYNGSVDYVVAGATIDAKTVDDAVNAAATQGYAGIGFFITGETNCVTIENLTAEGIKLGAYNTLLDCVEEAGGIIDYAQAQYDAGMNSAKELIAAVPDGGKVGIITSEFTRPGAEERRLGFIDGLEGSNITIVNEGVEANDSSSETYTAAQNFIQSTPDLIGIYATAGGPFGAAQAVAEQGLEDQIKVIGYDITAENIAALENGSMYGVTGQDAFGQGYNVAIELFNAVVTGETPDQVLVPAESPFVTLENLPEHDPRVLPVGTLGTS